MTTSVTIQYGSSSAQDDVLRSKPEVLFTNMLCRVVSAQHTR